MMTSVGFSMLGVGFFSSEKSRNVLSARTSERRTLIYTDAQIHRRTNTQTDQVQKYRGATPVILAPPCNLWRQINKYTNTQTDQVQKYRGATPVILAPPCNLWRQINKYTDRPSTEIQRGHS